MRRIKSILILIVLLFLTSVKAHGFSSYWIGDWNITDSYKCNITTCCCFSNFVNIYGSANSEELYINGSVNGISCNSPVEQDHMAHPLTLTFTNEFFGVNSYTFTLANSTDLSGLTITAIDDLGACSFQLYRQTNSLIYNTTHDDEHNNHHSSLGKGWIGIGIGIAVVFMIMVALVVIVIVRNKWYVHFNPKSEPNAGIAHSVI